MAVISAQYTEAVEYNGYTGLFNNEYTIVKPAGDVRAVEEGVSIIGDVYLYAGNVSVPAKRVLSGVFLPAWYEDYYNKIIVSPSLFSLKTLASEVTEEFWVWNAYLSDSKTMTSVTENGAGGIELTGLTPPVVFMPGEEKVYNISVGLAGPAVIDATYGFVFTGEAPELKITGQRLTIWTFIPQMEIKEKLEWKTNILQTYDGEQRIALREAPRQELKYKYFLNEQEYSIAKAIGIQWGGNFYGVPIWAEVFIYGDIPSGTTTLEVDTTIYDYFLDGFVFIWESNNKTVVRKIIGITDTEILLEYEIENFSNALIMPLKSGINQKGIKFDRGGYTAVKASSDFLIVNDMVITASGDGLDYPEYRDSQVVTNRQIALSGMSETIVRGMDYFDNGSGLIRMEPQTAYPRNKKMLSIWSEKDIDKWNNKAWLYSLVGKQKKFWIISWNADIIPIADVLTSELTIKCQHISYELYRNVTDIVLIKTDGTFLFNRILAGAPFVDGESLVLEAAFPEDLATEDIEKICFMSLVRLDSDKVTINYGSGLYTTIKIPVIEIPA